jgi:hypothetical protein
MEEVTAILGPPIYEGVYGSNYPGFVFTQPIDGKRYVREIRFSSEMLHQETWYGIPLGVARTYDAIMADLRRLEHADIDGSGLGKTPREIAAPGMNVDHRRDENGRLLNSPGDPDGSPWAHRTIFQNSVAGDAARILGTLGPARYSEGTNQRAGTSTHVRFDFFTDGSFYIRMR